MRNDKLLKQVSKYENLAVKNAFDFEKLMSTFKEVDYSKFLKEIKDYTSNLLDPKKKQEAEEIERQLSSSKGQSVKTEWDKLIDKFKHIFDTKDSTVSSQSKEHKDGTVSLQLKDFKNPIKSQYHNIGEFNVPHAKNPNRKHLGVDLAAPRGTPVYASAPGEVYYIGSGGTSGNIIQIRHSSGYKTFYMHLDSIDAKVNDKVSQDTVIGKVGDTGNAKGTHPHLHFEVRKDESPIDPASVGIKINPPDVEFMRQYARSGKEESV